MAIEHVLENYDFGLKGANEKKKLEIKLSQKNVTLHLLLQAISGDIWKHTEEKSQTNTTNKTMYPRVQTIWGHIWKHTVKRSKEMQLMRLEIFSYGLFEGTFENT